MLKFAAGFILLGVALVPFAQISPQSKQHKTILPPLQNSIYRVVAANGDQCKIMLTPAAQVSQLAASPQADCMSLDERVDSIRIWLTLANGNLSLRDHSNQELMVLRPAGPETYKTEMTAELQFSITREK